MEDILSLVKGLVGECHPGKEDSMNDLAG